MTYYPIRLTLILINRFNRINLNLKIFPVKSLNGTRSAARWYEMMAKYRTLCQIIGYQNNKVYAFRLDLKSEKIISVKFLIPVQIELISIFLYERLQFVTYSDITDSNNLLLIRIF